MCVDLAEARTERVVGFGLGFGWMLDHLFVGFGFLRWLLELGRVNQERTCVGVFQASTFLLLLGNPHDIGGCPRCCQVGYAQLKQVKGDDEQRR